VWKCADWCCGTDVFTLCQSADADVFDLSTEEFMTLTSATQ
jgi:hypothetical protein